MFTTTCDKCKKEFVIQPKDLKKRKMNRDKITYFTCPHCNKEYVYMIFNKDIEKRRKRLNELYAELEPMKNVGDRLALKKRIDRLKSEAMKEVNRLKKKYER